LQLESARLQLAEQHARYVKMQRESDAIKQSLDARQLAVHDAKEALAQARWGGVQDASLFLTKTWATL
jgi:hypothetical protein